jgi:hypothetical protein
MSASQNEEKKEARTRQPPGAKPASVIRGLCSQKDDLFRR